MGLPPVYKRRLELLRRLRMGLGARIWIPVVGDRWLGLEYRPPSASLSAATSSPRRTVAVTRRWTDPARRLLSAQSGRCRQSHSQFSGYDSLALCGQAGNDCRQHRTAPEAAFAPADLWRFVCLRVHPVQWGVWLPQ